MSTILMCWWNLSWADVLVAEHLNKLGKIGKGVARVAEGSGCV